MRLDHVPSSLSERRDRWILESHNPQLATAAALSRLIGDQSDDPGNTLSAANMTQALAATPSAAHVMVLSLIAAQRYRTESMEALTNSDAYGQRFVHHQQRLEALRKATASATE